MNRVKARLNMLLHIPGIWRFDGAQLYEIHSGFYRYNLSVKQVKVYAKEELNPDIMASVKRGLAKGASCRDMEICLEMSHSAWRINAIAEGIRDGLPASDILRYSSQYISDEEAFAIYSESRSKMWKDGTSTKK